MLILFFFMVTFSMNLSAQSYDDAIEWLNSKMKIGCIRLNIRDDCKYGTSSEKSNCWIADGILHMEIKYNCPYEYEGSRHDFYKTSIWQVPLNKIKSVSIKSYETGLVVLNTFGDDCKNNTSEINESYQRTVHDDYYSNWLFDYIKIDVSESEHGEENFPSRFTKAMNDIIAANKKAMGINEKY